MMTHVLFIHLFIHFPLNGHLSCSSFLGLETMSRLYMSLFTCRELSRREIIRRQKDASSTLWNIDKLLHKMLVQLTGPLAGVCNVLSFHVCARVED